MKTLIIFLGVQILTHAGVAGTLYLSGTVPDRGFTLVTNSPDNHEIKTNHGSVLKVYVAEIKSVGRSPQSVAPVATTNSNEKNWKQVTGSQSLTISSYVKVEAP